MKLVLTLLLSLPTISWAEQIRVTDREGRPVAGATVVLGNELGQRPDLVTDQNGYFQIPGDWKSAVDVTLRAAGFIQTSFARLEPQQTVLQLSREDARQFFEVKGQAVDYQGIKKDGKVDFGLIYPAMSRRDVIDFDMNTLISPENDEIDVITDTVGIPSNLSLPQQTETYLLPITLNKPQFRLFVRRPGTYRVMASQGRFPLARVINELQNGKSIFQVLNNFDFMNAGQIEVTVAGDMTIPNISVKQITNSATVSVVGPAIPAGHGVITAALVNQGGLFFPTDLKGLAQGQTTALKIPQSSDDAYFLSLMTEEPKSRAANIATAEAQSPFGPIAKALNRMFMFFGRETEQPRETKIPTGVSLTLQQAKGAVTPDFIDMVPVPQRVNDYQLAALAPATKSNIVPVATYAVLSEIELPSRSGVKIEKRFRVWENFFMGWKNDINLPHVKVDTKSDKKYRWEIYYLGRRLDASETPEYFLDGITHVSRNSVDLY